MRKEIKEFKFKLTYKNIETGEKLETFGHIKGYSQEDAVSFLRELKYSLQQLVSELREKYIQNIPFLLVEGKLIS